MYKKKCDVFSKQRFGLIPYAPKDKKVIWLHAVSVGETLSIEHLVTLIKKKVPNSFCYLTIGTETAKNIAQKNIPADCISYLPYDILPCMLLAYQRINPHALIIIEAELWPNLLMMSRLKNIKLYGLNARMSNRSEKQNDLLKLFYKFLLHHFDMLFVQSSSDKEKFNALGLSQKKLIVLGNLKTYNVTIKKDAVKQLLHPKHWSFPILLAGSIHPGELNHYLELFKALKPHYPDLKLILAPRHFTWKQDLINELLNHKISFIMWDQKHPLEPHAPLSEQLAHIFKKHDILVVCVLGELFKLYHYADIFFLGGTFVPVGGHNLLEPAAWGVPTIIGPQHWNCQDQVLKLEHIHALFIAHDQKELIRDTQKLLDHQEQQHAIKNNILAWLNDEAHHVKKVLDQLMNALK